MTDKEKIRKEVERLRKIHQMKYQQLDADSSMSLVECGKRNLCNELLSFIDSIQSEEDDDDAWLNDIISKAECNLQLNKGEIDWLKSLKDRAQPQPRQEWSEEDENHVKSILSTIECCKAQFPNAQAVVEAYNADIEWLKSLRPQSQWRPSDKQMKALDIAIRCGIQLGTWEEDALKSLYQELMYKARDEHFKMF